MKKNMLLWAVIVLGILTASCESREDRIARWEREGKIEATPAIQKVKIISSKETRAPKKEYFIFQDLTLDKLIRVESYLMNNEIISEGDTLTLKVVDRYTGILEFSIDALYGIPQDDMLLEENYVVTWTPVVLLKRGER